MSQSQINDDLRKQAKCLFFPAITNEYDFSNDITIHLSYENLISTFSSTSGYQYCSFVNYALNNYQEKITNRMF